MKHSLEIDGRIITFWTYGQPNQPIIIAIHGFRGTHHGLELIAEQLKNDFYVIIPDLPGFGESEPLDTHSITGYTRFLLKFIAKLNLKVPPESPPILLGHSFGSIITSHFAAEHPAAISHLILINPIGAPALEGPKAAMTKLAIFYYWLGQKLPQKASHTWLSAKPIVMGMSVTMTKTKDKTLRRYIHDQHLSHFSSFASPGVVAEAFKASVSHTVREKAEHITMPTLLIVGEKDDITPLAKQQELHQLTSNSELFVIEKVGHLIHYETPSQAAKAIIAFLQAPSK